MTTNKSTTPNKIKAPAAPKAPKAAAPARAPRRKAAGGLKVFIDYPREGELMRPNHYTIRIGTVPAAATVELSIDGGIWTPCREAAGYWWFDWSGIVAGPHHLQVRAQGEAPVPVTAERYVSVGADAEPTPVT